MPPRPSAHAGRGDGRGGLLLGLSVKGAVTKDMVKSMAADPIIFAMANPDPEITPEEVREAAFRRNHGDGPV
jgi:malic enzyme